MFTMLWLFCVVAIFIVDVRTGALSQKDLSPRRCHHCSHNSTACELPQSVVMCPVGQPFCATVATAPNFTSTLTCAAASVMPCSLRFNSKLILEIICICEDHLCNSPYSIQLRRELINFSPKISANSTELTTTFFNSSGFMNVTLPQLYKSVTKLGRKSIHEKAIGGVSIGSSEELPRAEALKNEATVPPDDEDEGEGSGTFEENKTQAAPAAPSSYLPAEKSNASAMYLKLLLVISLLSLFIMI